MKTETLLVLGVLAYLFTRKSPALTPAPCYPVGFVGPLPPGGWTCAGTDPIMDGTSGTGASGDGGSAGGIGPIVMVNCDDPNADPVMCAQIRILQGQK